MTHLTHLRVPRPFGAHCDLVAETRSVGFLGHEWCVRVRVCVPPDSLGYHGLCLRLCLCLLSLIWDSDWWCLRWDGDEHWHWKAALRRPGHDLRTVNGVAVRSSQFAVCGLRCCGVAMYVHGTGAVVSGRGWGKSPGFLAQVIDRSSCRGESEACGCAEI